MIVADTGPIIAFARIGRLGLLHDVAGVLMIPEAVYEELVGRGHNRPGAAEVAQGIWIHRRTVNDAAAVAHLPRLLHAGEREAIILATELNAQLLIDETERTARGGLIPAVRPIIAELLAAGYWIDEEVIRVFLQEMGEEPLTPAPPQE
jgi:predicted nucleic acid-binding protein